MRAGLRSEYVMLRLDRSEEVVMVMVVLWICHKCVIHTRLAWFYRYKIAEYVHDCSSTQPDQDGIVMIHVFYVVMCFNMM